MDSDISSPKISVIIPLLNEEGSIAQLIEETQAVLNEMETSFEIVLIDDGSTDQTWPIVSSIAEKNQQIRAVRFQKNQGQTAAMSAGFDYSSGKIIIPMDGDLQNDPADIPRLLDKLNEGYDVVSGWRRMRQDRGISRVLPSKIANKLISLVGGVKLHDYGCSLKVYRRDVVKDVRLYGEMHRFIPIYASWHGARIVEMEVNHRARKFGKSKYGIGRTVKVILDLIVVKFLADYLQKPIYIFGGLGLVSIFGGFFMAAFALYLKYIRTPPKTFIETPLPLLTALFLLMGVNALLIGLLAEINMRTYYESQKKPPYKVKETVNAGEDRSKARNDNP